MLKPFEEKMKKSVAKLETDLSRISAGRANPRILDNITVDYYGAKTPVSQVGNITIPEAKIIQIQPWDVSVLKDLEKAINVSDIGINPSNDGKVIRLVFPELTKERRKELTKDIKKKGEESKVAIRNIRREGMDSLKKSNKDNGITDDDLKQKEDELQKLTDENIKNIDGVINVKCDDIMSI